tara:strand:+ start:1343 stop:1942 length:600 start_codon:yes stop_codon:yes gene_type:complete
MMADIMLFILHNFFLNIIYMIDIHDDVFTCSTKMRNDIIDFCKDKEPMSMLEIGTHRGYTNKYLAPYFTKITGTENLQVHIDYFKDHNQAPNTEILNFDVYAENWNKLPDVDVVFIDCVHSYDGCKSDVDNSLKRYPDLKYIIFDDYEVWQGVNDVVTEYVQKDIFKVERLIGLDTIIGGHPSKDGTKGKQEGIIVSLK